MWDGKRVVAVDEEALGREDTTSGPCVQCTQGLRQLYGELHTQGLALTCERVPLECERTRPNRVCW